MMFGWESNKTMLRKYMVDHAHDIGKFWGEILLESPSIYLKFLEGLYEGVNTRNSTEKKE